MSGGISFQVDGLERVNARIRNFANVEHEIPELLENLGGIVASQIKTRIHDSEGAPDGDPWVELDPVYAERKRALKGDVGLLQFEGHLLESINYEVDGDSAVYVGSGLIYANYQHAMRPFIGLSADNLDELDEVLDEWLEGLEQ